MTDGILGVTLALVIAASSFLFGLALGFAGGKKSGKAWLKENGCYLCQEKLEYYSWLDDK